GGVLGAVTKEQEHALREFGFNLGIAFQLVDDLLDYTAEESALGKPVGGDLREGKVTLPIIYLLRDGGEQAERIIRRVVADRAVTKEQWRDIIRMLREQNASEMAYAKATEYATIAKTSLDVFPPSREREALVALADYVLSRDR
ncbi:MAG: polyprenyl synthetase family protein, partial [Vicinamibacterales bacterium]